MSPLPQRLVAVLVLGTAIACATPTATTSATSPALEIVGSHLNNPRKLSIAANGTLYVAEAGTGGGDKCFGTNAEPVCVGRSGSVTRIANGVQRRVVGNLV